MLWWFLPYNTNRPEIYTCPPSLEPPSHPSMSSQRKYLKRALAQTVKHLPTMRAIWVQSLGREDLLEREMATRSRTLAWKIPWMEEPGRLQSMGSQRVGPDWATSLEKGSKQCLVHTKCLLLFLPQLKIIIRLVSECSVARLKFLRAGTMSVLLTTVSSGPGT